MTSKLTLSKLEKEVDIVFMAIDPYGHKWEPYIYDNELYQQWIESDIQGFGIPPLFFTRENLFKEIIFEIQRHGKNLELLCSIPNNYTYKDDIAKIKAIIEALIRFVFG